MIKLCPGVGFNLTSTRPSISTDKNKPIHNNYICIDLHNTTININPRIDFEIRSERTYTLDTLAGNRAFWSTCTLLSGLVCQFTTCNKTKHSKMSIHLKTKLYSLVFEKLTWGFDDPVLVGLGGVAVTRTVYKALHHFSF